MFFLRDDRIEFESHCKFLGVLIDESLRFGKHIEHVSGKFKKNTGISFRIRDLIPMDVRSTSIMPSFSLIYLIMWLTKGETSDSLIKPIIIQQKRIIRTIFNSSR